LLILLLCWCGIIHSMSCGMLDLSGPADSVLMWHHSQCATWHLVGPTSSRVCIMVGPIMVTWINKSMSHVPFMMTWLNQWLPRGIPFLSWILSRYSLWSPSLYPCLSPSPICTQRNPWFNLSLWLCWFSFSKFILIVILV
jgi:hypothetical protein